MSYSNLRAVIAGGQPVIDACKTAVAAGDVADAVRYVLDVMAASADTDEAGGLMAECAAQLVPEPPEDDTVGELVEIAIEEGLSPTLELSTALVAHAIGAEDDLRDDPASLTDAIQAAMAVVAGETDDADEAASALANLIADAGLTLAQRGVPAWDLDEVVAGAMLAAALIAKAAAVGGAYRIAYAELANWASGRAAVDSYAAAVSILAPEADPAALAAELVSGDPGRQFQAVERAARALGAPAMTPEKLAQALAPSVGQREPAAETIRALGAKPAGVALAGLSVIGALTKRHGWHVYALHNAAMLAVRTAEKQGGMPARAAAVERIRGDRETAEAA
jgi:hypothetical protein